MTILKGAKGTHIILMMGIVSIFIAAFFILFAFDKLVSTNAACILYSNAPCTGETVTTATYGLYLIFGLSIMIVGAVYIMYLNIKVEREYGYKKGRDKP